MKKEFLINNEVVVVDILAETAQSVSFVFNEKTYLIAKNGQHNDKLNLGYNGINHTVVSAGELLAVDGREVLVENPKKSRKKSKTHEHGQMISPMPGRILKVFVNVGDGVKLGEPILIMEAMKMEHTIKASHDGKIEKISYQVGDQVSGGVELVTIC